MTKIARNTPCPCGSGKKYKKCCFGKGDAPQRAVGHAVVTTTIDIPDLETVGLVDPTTGVWTLLMPDAQKSVFSAR